MKEKVKMKSLSPFRLFVIPLSVAYQASSFMGFFQARVPEWVAISFSRGSSQPRVELLHCRQMLYPLRHQGRPSEREVDVFVEFPCILYDLVNVGIFFPKILKILFHL